MNLNSSFWFNTHRTSTFKPFSLKVYTCELANSPYITIFGVRHYIFVLLKRILAYHHFLARAYHQRSWWYAVNEKSFTFNGSDMPISFMRKAWHVTLQGPNLCMCRTTATISFITTLSPLPRSICTGKFLRSGRRVADGLTQPLQLSVSCRMRNQAAVRSHLKTAMASGGAGLVDRDGTVLIGFARRSVLVRRTHLNFSVRIWNFLWDLTSGCTPPPDC